MKKYLLVLSVISLSVGGNSYAQITVDGTLSESQYITLATKLNSNSGFGTAIDVSRIVYYPDVTNSILYIGVVGKLDATNNNAIGLWLNVAGSGSPTGVAAGNPLGGVSLTSAYFGNSGNNNFKADFEVDYQFSLNPGTSSTHCYVDAVDMVGTPTAVYLGDCGQSGSSTTGTLNSQTVTFAFDNSGATNTGLEIALPFSAIGATSADFIQIATFVVSQTAYFSDVTVPGDVTTGNLGNNPDFGSLANGPYHVGNGTSDVPLPVEMSAYTATYSPQGVTLSWKTQSELNNAGFNIYRKAATEASYSVIAGYQTDPALRGLGTSTTGKSYSFTDSKVTAGAMYDYKIEDVTTGGTTKDFGPIRVQAERLIPTEYALGQNYPNPFNPSTTINVGVKKTGYARLEVFNALGQKVATLLNGTVQAGSLHYSWNASEFPSGIYFYRFTTDGFTAMKKMLLLK